MFYPDAAQTLQKLLNCAVRGVSEGYSERRLHKQPTESINMNIVRRSEHEGSDSGKCECTAPILIAPSLSRAI